MIVAASRPKDFKIGAWLIMAGTNSDFSHVLLIDNDALVLQASHGFVNATAFEVFIEENDLISCFEIPDFYVDLKFAKSQLGKKYGKFQLVKAALKILFKKLFFKDNGNARFICSEYIGKVLHLKWVNDTTTPAEIVDYLKTIGENISREEVLKRFL